VIKHLFISINNKGCYLYCNRITYNIKLCITIVFCLCCFLGMFRDNYNLIKIRNIYKEIYPIIPSEIDISPIYQIINSFRLIFPYFQQSFQLSIACPSDMRYGYCETAFIYNNNLIYPLHLDYDDVKRFQNIFELLDEISMLNETLKNSECILKKFFDKCIKKQRAKRKIKEFILEYKDQFLYRPFGQYYYQYKKDFEKYQMTHKNKLC